MEFEGVVHKIMPPVSGASARGTWTKQEVVFEMPAEFNKKACVSFWGDKVQEVAQLHPGDRVKVSFNIESREYNGRWFTELRAWRIVKDTPVETVVSPAGEPPLEGAYDLGEDMPF